MSLDKATVMRIARLARIGLAAEEAEAMAGELNEILGWVEQLGEVETGGVQPVAADRGLPRREDRVSDGSCAEAILQNAPEPAEGGYFAVPKVVE